MSNQTDNPRSSVRCSRANIWHKYGPHFAFASMAYPIGETAAIMTSVMWTMSSIFFAAAGKKIGSIAVNSIRIVIAIPLLCVVLFATTRTIFPVASQAQWFYMSLSGVIGLALGDFAYFAALVMLGPRRGVLVMAMAPIFTAFSAYFIMGELLNALAILGVSLTLSGVFVAIMEREGASDDQPLTKKQKTLGIALGIGGAVGQGVGYALSRYGMVGIDPSHPLDPLPATLIRVLVATATIWFIVAVWGKLPDVAKGTKDRRALQLTFGGAFVGPFMGVWLSMIAAANTVAGIAATLMSLMPIMVIPVVWVLYKQKTSWRGIVGACVAVIGVAILFMV